jgi:hypothetical protein
MKLRQIVGVKINTTRQYGSVRVYLLRCVTTTDTSNYKTAGTLARQHSS